MRGLAPEICAQINEQAFDWLDAPIIRVAGADVPLPYAANLEHAAMPQIEDIALKASKLVKGEY